MSKIDRLMPKMQIISIICSISSHLVFKPRYVLFHILLEAMSAYLLFLVLNLSFFALDEC